MGKYDLEIIPLIKEGKSAKEISEIVGCAISTVRSCAKSNNLEIVKLRGSMNKDKEIEILKLLDEGMSLKEIADKLEVCEATIRNYKHKLKNEIVAKRTPTKAKEKIELTQIQLEVLYGSLLGDMSIDKTSGRTSRLVINQGGEQEAYFDYKCKIFENLLGKINKSNRYDKRTDKWYHKYSVRFLANPVYNNIYEELYLNNIKTVTKNWLNKVTERGLAFWFMDDGNNKGVLATNCFSYEECSLIKEWFLEKWNIEVTIEHQKGKSGVQYVIYFPKEAKNKFYKLTHQYFIPEMEYKIKNWNP